MALGTQLRDLVDSFSELTAQHLRLARVELADDVKYLGTRVGVIAALAPLILVGYGSLCVALAFLLQRVMPFDLAFFIVGLVNVAGGAFGIFKALKALQARPLLDETVAQLGTTAEVVRLRPAEGTPGSALEVKR